MPFDVLPIHQVRERSARDTKERPDLKQLITEWGELWEVFVIQEGTDNYWTAEQWMNEELPNLEELLGR